MAAASSGKPSASEPAATPKGLCGARVAQAALETSPAKHTARPARSGSRLRRAPEGKSTEGEAPGESSDVPDDVDDDHVETWRLVQQAQQGNADAFGQLYDRYVSMVFRFIYYRVNDRALAEDFTSETFLRALRRISTITYQGRDIGAWFMTIARNIVLDHVKSARHRLETATAETPEAREQEPSTEHAVLAGLESETLMAAVGELGDEQRECIMLRFIHGMSVSETAQIMGKNDGAVKALQHRAVRKLAERVRGELQ
jgi:RNA polymerase sigma-70 factor, ECF subfamily